MAKILIVDDQPDFLINLEKILTQHHHTVVNAINVFDAIEMLKKENFDVLVTDAVLPGRTGFDVVTTLRKMPAFENFPVIMLKSNDPHILLSKLDSILLKNSLETGVHQSIAVRVPVHWQDQTVVVELSEVGATLLTNVQVTIGSKLLLNNEFYSLIGMAPLALRIVNCTPDKEHKGLFKIKALFVEPRKIDVAALNTFIEAQTKKAAA